MLEFLKDIFTDLCKKWECQLVEFIGESNHVHLLISLNPKVQPSRFVNNLKTVSSRLVRKEFKEHLKNTYSKPVFWSRSYCIISSGGASLDVLKQYIESQQEPE